MITKAVLLAAACSVLTGAAVRRWDEAAFQKAVAKAFDDGRAWENGAESSKVDKLQSKIRALVSVDEAINEGKDVELNQSISQVYHDGATPEESADLRKARRAQAWHSLKYRIIFGQDPDVK